MASTTTTARFARLVFLLVLALTRSTAAAPQAECQLHPDDHVLVADEVEAWPVSTAPGVDNGYKDADDAYHDVTQCSGGVQLAADEPPVPTASIVSSNFPGVKIAAGFKDSYRFVTQCSGGVQLATDEPPVPTASIVSRNIPAVPLAAGFKDSYRLVDQFPGVPLAADFEHNYHFVEQFPGVPISAVTRNSVVKAASGMDGNVRNSITSKLGIQVASILIAYKVLPLVAADPDEGRYLAPPPPDSTNDWKWSTGGLAVGVAVLLIVLIWECYRDHGTAAANNGNRHGDTTNRVAAV